MVGPVAVEDHDELGGDERDLASADLRLLEAP